MPIIPGINGAVAASFNSSKNGPAGIVPSAANMLLSLRGDSLSNLAPQSLTTASGDTAPSIINLSSTAKSLLFSGSSSVGLRYTYNTNLHITPPWSVTLDFNCGNANASGAYIFTIGEGYGYGWPEISIIQNSNSINIVSSSNNNGDTFSQTFSIVTNVWNRIGVMFYTANSNTNIRIYLNGSVKYDGTIAIPYNSQNATSDPSAIQYAGTALGGDKAKYSSRQWNGQIKNFYMGKTLFWTI